MVVNGTTNAVSYSYFFGGPGNGVAVDSTADVILLAEGSAAIYEFNRATGITSTHHSATPYDL